MTRSPIYLAICLAFVTSISLSGCDSKAKLSAEDHIQLAKDMAAEGNYKGMVIELKNAIQKSPDNAQARLLLGEAYLHFKQGDDAKKELDRARDFGVSASAIRPLLGEALILTKEYQRVLDELQVTDVTQPRERARVLQLRGDALLGLRKFEEGCALYRESVAVDPQWHKALSGVASCDFAQGKIPEARLALQQATKFAPNSAEAWIMLSKLERSQNRPDEALAALDNALKANESSLEARFERISLLIAQGDLESAKKDAARLRALYPKHFMSDYVQALVSFHEKDLQSARELIARSLQAAPGYVPAMLLSGAIEFSLGNMRTAETLLARVVQNWPRHAYAIRLLAATRLQLGDVKDAADTLAVLNPESSSNPAVLITAGDIAMAQKNSAAANRYFERAAKLNPDNAAVRAQLGIARLGEGDPRAISDLMAASTMDPEWRGADRVLILTQIRNKDFQGALTSIDALEKKEPNSPEPWNYRGVVYLSQKNFPKARENFERAQKLSPGHFPSAANLAELDLHERKPDAAKRRFESVLRADPNNINAMLSLAALAAQAGDDKEYLTRLEQANKTAPSALRPFVLLNSYYLARGDAVKALLYARQANDAHPNHPDALGILGNTQLASGDAGGALSTFRKGVEVTPASADAHLRLARAQRANQQAAAARASLAKALELEPANVAAQDALLQLELSERNFEKAMQFARKLQSAHPKASLGFEREGDVRLAQGQPAQAVAAFEQALNHRPSSVGFVKLLRALHFSGNTKSMEEKLAAWLKQHPQDKLVHAYAAEFYMVTQRNRNAIFHYEHLISLDANQPAYLNNLAILYQREKDRRARATAERALKLAPNAAGIQDTLGWILLEQGDVKTGLDWLKKAYSGAPRVATVHYHYAVALARNGDTTQAKKELQALLTAHPRFADADAARKLLATL